MNLDRTLQAEMERALCARADGGPNADPPAAERKVPRASLLAKGCARASYYFLTDAPKADRTPASASATTLGQAIEDDVLADLAAAMPGFWRYQVRVETDWFRGTADAVLYDSEPEACVRCYGDGQGDTGATKCEGCGGRGVTGFHALLVADSKSANTASWEIKERQGSCGEDVEAQLQLYMHALGAKEAVAVFRKTGGNARDMAKGVYLPIRFPYRPEVVERMKGLAEQAMAGKRQSVAPEPGFKRGHWLCKDYCDYRAICPSGGGLTWTK